MAKKWPKISGIANLTPESDSMPKITIGTTLRWVLAQNGRILRPVLENLADQKRYCPLLFNNIFYLIFL